MKLSRNIYIAGASLLFIGGTITTTVLLKDNPKAVALKQTSSMVPSTDNLPPAITAGTSEATSTDSTQPKQATAHTVATSSVTSAQELSTPQPTNPFTEGFSAWYVFNRRAEIGKTMPNSDSNLQSYCYQVDQSLFVSSPQQYSIACTTLYGRSYVAFVEQINADGSLWVSAMNSGGQTSITDTTSVGGWDRVSYSLVPAGSLSAYRFLN